MDARIDDTKIFESREDGTGQIPVAQGASRKNPNASVSARRPPVSSAIRSNFGIVAPVADIAQV
jgi:hypothetical protein